MCGIMAFVLASIFGVTVVGMMTSISFAGMEQSARDNNVNPKSYLDLVVAVKAVLFIIFPALTVFMIIAGRLLLKASKLPAHQS